MISKQQLDDAVKRLIYQANFSLPGDIIHSIKTAHKKEKNSAYKKFLDVLLKNAEIARKKKLALCQDTGIPLVFIEIGSKANVEKGFNFNKAIKAAVKKAYKNNYLRDSLINDPLLRTAVIGTEPLIYTEFIDGKKIKISILIRGAGCENTTQLKMFSPGTEINTIEDHILNAVKEKILYACPPVTVGIGIGGDASKSVLLSKKAFLRPLSKTNISPFYNKLEKKLLNKINGIKLKILGKPVTTICLGVFIKHLPCHIASLPVTVSLQCHSYRRASVII